MADSTLGMDGESPIKIHRGGGQAGADEEGIKQVIEQ